MADIDDHAARRFRRDRSPRAPPGRSGRVDRAAAWPRTRSSPRSTATSATSAAPLPDGAERRHRHGRQRRRPPRAAPLHGPRAGPGGARSCSRARSSRSARPSRTASTTTSSCPAGARSARTTWSPSRRGCARSSPSDQPFVRDELSADEALALFADQPYKCEIIERAAAAQADAVRRRRGRRGRHGQRLPQHARVRRPLPRPARALDGPARPLQAADGSPAPTGGATRSARCCSASTARRGRPTPPSKEHLHRLEEAEKRDHRKLAAELDLLSFPEELGGGLAVWHPKGAIVRKLMEDYSRGAPRARRLRVRLHAAPRQGAAVRDVAATSTGTPTACTRRWRWTTARTTRSR